MSLKDRFKKWLPYIQTDLMMYVAMILIIGIGIIIMLVFKKS